MSEEKVYTFNEYVLGYDSGGDNDRSCLTISKILNNNIYVMSTLYDGSAKVISAMLDSLQQKVEQLEERCEYLERSNNRREDEIIELRDENVDLASKNNQLENIRKEAIEYINNNNHIDGCLIKWEVADLFNILNKGSDKE